MLGDNPKRISTNGDGSVLFVKSIFKTLQGEGPNVGMPAIFVRLGGCNLACSFCDTEFEQYSEQKLSSILQIIQRISKNKKGIKSVNLVIITGGEPFRQPINALCKELLNLNFSIQIETNGTLYRKIPKEVEIICSPKVVNRKYLSIRKDLLPHISAFKFLISSNIEGYSEVPELGQKEYNIPVFVQAMDEYSSEINIKNKHKAIDIDLSAFKSSALVNESVDVPKYSAVTDLKDEIPTTYVPARNTIFLSYALGFAEVVGAYDIFMGAHMMDSANYPDCRPEYLKSFEQMANLATKAGAEGKKISIHAPLIEMSNLR